MPQTFTSHTSEGWQSRIRVPARRVPVRTHFLRAGHLLAVPSLDDSRETSKHFPISPYKDLHAIVRAPPSLTNYLPKGPSPNTMTLGIRFWHRIWGGHKHEVHNAMSPGPRRGWLFCHCPHLLPLPVYSQSSHRCAFHSDPSTCQVHSILRPFIPALLPPMKTVFLFTQVCWWHLTFSP